MAGATPPYPAVHGAKHGNGKWAEALLHGAKRGNEQWAKANCNVRCGDDEVAAEGQSWQAQHVQVENVVPGKRRKHESSATGLLGDTQGARYR